MKKKNDIKKVYLDDYEKEMESRLAKGEFEEGNDDDKLIFHDATKNYIELNKSKPVTIRINQLDLVKIKAKAKDENIPYQTLLGVLIHQYAEGKSRIEL